MTENRTKRPKIVVIRGGRSAGRTVQAQLELLARIDELEAYKAIGTIEEFKSLKNTDIPIIHGKAELDLHDKEVRNKAIDDFAEKFIYKAVCEGCSGCCGCYEESRQSECEDWKSYMEIAEQLKGGGK